MLSYVVEQAGTAEIHWADTTGNIIRRIKTDVPNMGSLSWSPDGEWIAYSVKKIVNLPPPGVRVPIAEVYSKCTIHIVKAKGNAGEPREIVNGLPLQPMPAWVPETAFPVSPSTEKQTTLWGRLKQMNE